MASDIWSDHSESEIANTLPPHGLLFPINNNVILYVPSHIYYSTYHYLCYTSCGALAGTRNSLDCGDAQFHIMTAVQRVEYVTSQAGKQQVLHEGYRYRLNVRRQVPTHWMQGSLQYRWRSPPCGDRTESSTRIRRLVSSYESTETPSVGRCETCPAYLSKRDFSNDTSRQCHFGKRQDWTLLPQEKTLCLLTHRHDKMWTLDWNLDRNNRRVEIHVCGRWWKRKYSYLRHQMKCWTKCRSLRRFSWTERSTFIRVCGVSYIPSTVLVDDVMYPVAYAILPWKSKETYVRLFTLINAAAHTRIGN